MRFSGDVRWVSLASVKQLSTLTCGVLLSGVVLLAPATSQAAILGSVVSETFSGKCLDIKNSSTASGAELVQYTCSGGRNQLFEFVPVNGYYQIKARHSNKCLAVENASTTRAAKIVQANCTTQDHMLWYGAGSGNQFQIKPKHTNMCMNINNGSRENLANIIQWPCGDDNDKWRINFQADDGNTGGGVNTSRSKWEGPYTMPLVAASAANLPDGRILTWSAYAKMTFGGSFGKTYTSVFDPATNTANEGLVSNTGHDMFCPGTAVLADGKILVTGGSNNKESSIYDPLNGTWAIADKMNTGRGYHAMTPLSDGSILTVGGSWSGGVFRKSGEVWSPQSGWQSKTELNSPLLLTNDVQGNYRSDNHMWLFEAPNGAVFHAGPAENMNWITLDGNGSVRSALKRGDDTDAINGNAVMYDIGKILTIGGAPNYINSDASNRAYVIDITGDMNNVSVKRVGNMAYRRAFHNSVVLPSGEVVVIGGHQRAIPFSDERSVMVTEIWNPTTQTFKKLSTMSVPRNYHSVALLMKDGRIFAAGGGLCGGCSTNHPNAEIFTPPYLLDANGNDAIRPVLSNVPGTAEPGDRIRVNVDTTTEHTFALVRMAATTHAVNNDERRIPLVATNAGNGNYTLNIPANKSVVIAGNYFLFAMNDKGVPSIASTINIREGNGGSGNQLLGTIVSEAYSGKCVDVLGASTASGTDVVQLTCSGANSQTFEFKPVNGAYQIKPRHSGKCLAVQGASYSNNAKIIQTDCSSQDHMLWYGSGSGSEWQISAKHSGQCLSISGGSQSDYATLVQSQCGAAASSKWSINLF